MGKFRFAGGIKVLINKIPHRFVTKIEDGWQLVALSNNLLHNFTTQELERLYALGDLVHDRDQVDDTPQMREARKRRDLLPISDQPPKVRERVTFKRALLREVDERTIPGTRFAKITVNGKETTIIESVLADISREHAREKPVSLSTYYRWRGEEPDDLQGKFSNRGRKSLHPTVSRTIIAVMNEAIQEGKAKNRKGKRPTVTITRIKATCEPLIQTARKADPTIPQELPSRSTYYNYWNEFPARDRAEAKFGKTRARQMFRGVWGHREREAVLDLSEYDSTPLPFFFFDEEFGVPLGRGWLNWCLEVFAQMPQGFCLGFEPPGDLTISSAVRHACLPKHYVQDEYAQDGFPKILHPWLGAGIPRLLQFDNGLAEWGETIRDITDNLETFYKFARVRTPWFKPIVELMFNVLNQTLLREMPGFALGKTIHSKDYDSTKNGCIGIRHFLYIFHYWLCEIYCRQRHGEFGFIPNERWYEGSAIHEPEFLGGVDKTD